MGEGYWLARELKDEKQKLIRQERMEALEQRVYEHSGQVIEAMLAFAEVSPHQTEPPPAWVEQYGLEAAEKRLKVAQAMWLPASVAPVGLKNSIQVFTGISRGQKFKNSRLTQNNLNVTLNLPAPTSREHPGPVVYEVRDLEE